MNAKIENNEGDDIKTKDYYLRLRGLPYSAKDMDIRQFFDALMVDEVQILTLPDGRASGEAFVGFATIEDAEQGMLRDKNKIGSRYVEVFRVTEPEFARIKNYSGYSGANPPQRTGSGGIIRIRGLPYSCKQNELLAFFQGLNVEEVVFGKEPGEGGRPTGEGYVRFASQEEAEAAMQYNGQHLGKRYLELFPSDLEQFERFKRQQSGAMPLNSLNYDWSQWYGGSQDYYGWDPYASHAYLPPPRARGGYRGGYHGYKDYSNRPSPYDYHGRVYGGDMSAYSGYDAYGYSTSQAYSDPSAALKIHVRGLPFRVNASQIIEFFNPLQCVEIKLGYLPDGRASGDGIVEFAQPEDVQEAMKKDRQMIGSRYIEIFAPNTMRVAPGTVYKKIGGTGRPQAATPAASASLAAAAYESYDYQW